MVSWPWKPPRQRRGVENVTVTSGRDGVGETLGSGDGGREGDGAGRGRGVASGTDGPAEGDGEADRVVPAPPGPSAVDGTPPSGVVESRSDGTAAHATRPHSLAAVWAGAFPGGWRSASAAPVPPMASTAAATPATYRPCRISI